MPRPTALRGLESGSGPGSLLVASINGVENRGVLAIAGEANIGDRHETEPRILDFFIERAGHDLFNLIGEAPYAGIVVHGSLLE